MSAVIFSTLVGSTLLANAALLQPRTITSQAVCQSGFEWMDNAEHTSPCMVAAELNGICNNNQRLVPALNSSINPNTSANTVSLCTCACTACQGFPEKTPSSTVYSSQCGSDKTPSGLEELAQHLVQKLQRTPAPQRLLVGVAGIPASGKSTFAVLLTERVNAILRQGSSGPSVPQESSVLESNGESHLKGYLNGVTDEGDSSKDTIQDQTILVGLDGWHLPRAQLDLFPDPKTAHDRRGIHWTFDGEGYVTFVKKLRDASNMLVVTAPSFDHALKDPTPDAVSIYPHHRIVIIEGLYVFLAIPPWSEGGMLLDERIFIEVDVAEAKRRLVKRHVVTGVAKDAKEAEWRADENDIPNGLFIISNMFEPTWTIQSKDIVALK